MKVFRLQDSTQTALSQNIDWFVSAEYTTNEVMAIPDPDGGKGNEPTSIPSPFARMDLTNTAFRYVNGLGNNAGLMYHKIVSDSLDIAEIFFHLVLFHPDIRIIEWDKVNDISSLRLSTQIEHKLLGETLEMYLKNTADAQAFNFNIFDKIYLLEYKHQIIGGTSPLTLFFNSANDLSGSNIVFPNSDVAFDDKLMPLNMRSDDFQIWLYSIKCYYPNFAGIFRELSTYMDICLEKLRIDNHSLFNKIHNLKASDYNYEDYDVIGKGVTMVNNLPLYQSRTQYGPITSDFEILSPKYLGEIKPLVLQHGHKGKTMGGKPMIYYNAPYNPSTEVPYFDDHQLDQRTLPGLMGIKYPYLTISDFLEPYMIRTIYPINKAKFFDGNFNKGSYPEDKGFVIPLKKAFFDYFDVDDLKRNIGTKPMFEIKTTAEGTATVYLRIPIRNGNHIEFSKEYQKPFTDGSFLTLDPIQKTGVIVENQFGISLFPFIKLKTDNLNHYRICLIDRDWLESSRSNTYSLNFFNSNPNIKIDVDACHHRSNRNQGHPVSSMHYVLENKSFDFIEINISYGAKGIIIPNFHPVDMGTKSSTFAVDFGTTNTHIEYRIGTESEDSKAFDITDNDVQIAYFHSITEDMQEESKQTLNEKKTIAKSLQAISERLLLEIKPDKITKGSNFSFPIRTAIAAKQGLNIEGETYAFADLNIPFYYEKVPPTPQIEIVKNLKWDSKKLGNEKYVEHFFENLLFLIRNKVLLNNGDLDKTSLIWFYPTSMLPGRRDMLERKWIKVYKKFISDSNHIKCIPESIAPFYWLKKKGGITAIDKPVASIDIGGGTTDVVIFVGNKPRTITSFRFAANAIFGDGYNESTSNNGFVQKYKKEIFKLLESNNLSKLKEVIEGISGSSNSVDIIAAFFAIENNKIYNKRGLVSFSELLQNDEDFVIVFTLFYAAIIFHICKLMQVKGLDAPAYITFSGTGSKIINIIDDSDGLKRLTKFTNLIFKNFYPECDVTLKKYAEPKEMTSKGGVYFDIQSEEIEIEELKEVLLGDKKTVLNDKNKLKYDKLDDKYFQHISSEFQEFLTIFENINDSLNFKKYLRFSKEDFLNFKPLLERKIIQDLKEGVSQKLEEIRDGKLEDIEETLFFYPLIGSLNRLAYQIYLSRLQTNE
jgi:hypothetical protein